MHFFLSIIFNYGATLNHKNNKMPVLQTYVRYDKISFTTNLRRGGKSVESILCIDIPVQMISCTDTTGKITPMKFRFCDRNGEIITITIDKILSTDQEQGSLGANFVCAATLYGMQRTFQLRYSFLTHKWRMSRFSV